LRDSAASASGTNSAERQGMKNVAVDAKFQGALFAYLTIAQGEVESAFARRHPGRTPYTLDVEIGRRFVRVVREGAEGILGRNVHCFIDMTTGDVRNAASYKSPGRAICGNIFKTTPATLRSNAACFVV